MQTTDPPKTSFNYNEAYWIGKGLIQMDIVDESGNSTTITKLFSGSATCISGVLNPRVYENTLYSTTNVTYLKLKITDSPMQTLTDDNVITLQNIVAICLEELLNGILSIGFRIPLVDDVTLDTPRLQMISNSIYVASNITYKTVEQEKVTKEPPANKSRHAKKKS